MWRLVSWLLPDAWWASIAIGAGALCYWEGQFLWGGPLPFSLAGLAITVVVYLTLREIERPNSAAGWAVPLLLILSLWSHPFALPFGLLALGFRWVFCPARRWQSIATAGALILFGFVIVRDSPDPDNAREKLSVALTEFHFEQLFTRLKQAVQADFLVAKYLFAIDSIWLSGYLYFVAIVHVVGFIASPAILFFTKPTPPVRALMWLVLVVALAYVFTPTLEALLPWWPQRILAIFSPFTFVAGIIGPWFLIQAKWPHLLQRSSPRPTCAWLVPAGLLVGIVAVQWPVMKLSADIKYNYENLRSEFMKSKLSNAYIVVSGVKNVEPFYLRAVPFLLFSDSALVERNILFCTEWHVQSRHPTRLAESWLELGRSRYEAKFNAQSGKLRVDLNAIPVGEAAFPTQNNLVEDKDMAKLALVKGGLLVNAGYTDSAIAQYRAAQRLDPQDWSSYHNMGVIQSGLKQWDAAVQSMEAALNLRPDSAEAYANLAWVQIDAGQIEAAVANFSKALALQPNFPRAQEGLRKARAKLK